MFKASSKLNHLSLELERFEANSEPRVESCELTIESRIFLR